MPACGKIMIAASLLACHSASALRVDSIGTRIARVDPAIWTAAAGIAATTRLQREAVSNAVVNEKYCNATSTAFGRNMKALGKVVRSMQKDYLEAFVHGQAVRMCFELMHLFATAMAKLDADYENRHGIKYIKKSAHFSGDNPSWPKVTRLLAGSAAATCFVMGGMGAAVSVPTILNIAVRGGAWPAAWVIGFLGPGRLLTRPM
jgi:hypothetical protein